jgi:hypothetical protein
MYFYISSLFLYLFFCYSSVFYVAFVLYHPYL